MMHRYGDQEGKSLAGNMTNTFATTCDKQYLPVFLSIFEDEKAIMQEGLKSFQNEMIKNYPVQEKQAVCRNFLDFCQKKEGSFWLIDFWLGFDSVRNFSLQNEESLELVLNMFFEFYCKLVEDIVKSLTSSWKGLGSRIVTFAELKFVLHKLESFWDILERPESDEALLKIQENKINLTALKMRIKKFKLFKIEAEWEEELKKAESEVLILPGNLHEAIADENQRGRVSESDLQRVLLSKRIFKKFALISEFLDKFTSFLDVDATRLENTEKLFRKIEHYLLKSQDPFFLTLPTLLLQSVRRVILGNRFQFPGTSTTSNAGDSEVLETLFSLTQNLSFLNDDFLNLGLSLILPPFRSEPIFLDPRVYEMVSWVFEIRLKKANLAVSSWKGLSLLLETTLLLGKVIKKTDQKQFLSKIFEVLLRMTIGNKQEAEIMREIKFKGRTRNLPKEHTVGTFGQYYEGAVIFGHRNYLAARNILSLEKALQSNPYKNIY